MRLRAGPGRVLAPALLVLLAMPPTSARAQEDVLILGDLCAAGNTTLLAAPCLEAALAAQAAQGAVGLALGGGSDDPGTPSTLGHRLGATPRIGVSLRLGGAWSHTPDLVRDPSPPVGSERFFTGALQGRVVVGAFQGFSLLPTVGGVLSLDLLATGGVAFLPSGFGFRGNAGSLGLGARVGIFRESFSLPGISLSATRRWVGSYRLGSFGQSGQEPEVQVHPRITSIRAVVGKDLLAVGLMAGMGWERYSGSARIRVASDGGSATGDARLGDLSSDRMLYFGGLSMTYLILQISAEAGWTGGYFDLPDRQGGLYDPSGGSFFGSLALRLTI